MLGPSCSSHPIIPQYLGISWDVPPVPALAQTRDWWDALWDPKVHGTMGQDGQEGPSMYPRPVTGGRYQGQVGCPIGSQGTMGQWDVPKSQLTFYGKNGTMTLEMP